MLILARNLHQIRFHDLMQVYSESNSRTGEEEWPGLPAELSREMAEQSFYQYLKDIFFPVEGALCAIWAADGAYVSTLRIEPYRDGLLLEGLETAPEHRKRGYALLLVRAVQKMLCEKGPVKLYSHVSKKNLPSRKLHEKCGFRYFSDCAAYIDGSVSFRACTYLFEG